MNRAASAPPYFVASDSGPRGNRTSGLRSATAAGPGGGLARRLSGHQTRLYCVIVIRPGPWSTAGGGAIRRREFITLIGGAAAWPLVARAQQQTIPVIGFLRPTRAEESGHLVAAVRQGLRESGYPNDKVVFDSRWGDGREEPLPKLAAELVALQVAAIAGSL